MTVARLQETYRVRIEPRLLRRPAAAAYMAVGETKFDELVADGRIPKPKRIDRCCVWERHELDNAIDVLLHVDDAPNPWDEAS